MGRGGANCHKIMLNHGQLMRDSTCNRDLKIGVYGKRVTSGNSVVIKSKS